MRIFPAPALAALLAAACAHTSAPAGALPSGAQTAEVHALFANAPVSTIVDGRVILPASPDADSATDRADRAIVRGPYTAERIEQARQDNAIDPFAAFDAVLGAEFNAEHFPATRALLMRVTRDAGLASQPPKELYARPRPFVRDPAQTTCVSVDPRLSNNGSYPSGHAAIGWAWGLVLAELDPAHADAVLRRGFEFAESRVVCGVHFPSDVAAGRDLGAAVVARLHADAEFRAALDAARAEFGG